SSNLDATGRRGKLVALPDGRLFRPNGRANSRAGQAPCPSCSSEQHGPSWSQVRQRNGPALGVTLMPASLVLALMLAIPAAEPAQATGSGASLQPDPAWKSPDNGLWFDAKGRRLIIRARVALREGPLEHLLCLKGTKEHEAILATDAAPYQIHAGLL